MSYYKKRIVVKVFGTRASKEIVQRVIDKSPCLPIILDFLMKIELVHLQKLNKNFYDEQIPTQLKCLNSDIGRINGYLNKMLSQPPSKYPERYKTAKQKIKDTWPLIHRLNVDIFRNVWEKCTDEPFIDLTKVKLDKW